MTNANKDTDILTQTRVAGSFWASGLFGMKIVQNARKIWIGKRVGR